MSEFESSLVESARPQSDFLKPCQKEKLLARYAQAVGV